MSLLLSLFQIGSLGSSMTTTDILCRHQTGRSVWALTERGSGLIFNFETRSASRISTRYLGRYLGRGLRVQLPASTSNKTRAAVLPVGAVAFVSTGPHSQPCNGTRQELWSMLQIREVGSLCEPHAP